MPKTTTVMRMVARTRPSSSVFATVVPSGICGVGGQGGCHGGGLGVDKPRPGIKYNALTKATAETFSQMAQEANKPHDTLHFPAVRVSTEASRQADKAMVSRLSCEKGDQGVGGLSVAIQSLYGPKSSEWVC